MVWCTDVVGILVLITATATVTDAANLPVKVSLTQKGYPQYLQYDLRVPSLREFTICLWVRFFDLIGDQTIFTYVLNGYTRAIRLWLSAGGRRLHVSFNEEVSSDFAVHVTPHRWHHVCMTYQADYGAWAVYLDSSLVSCEVAQALYGFVIPGGGSVLIGTAGDGTPNGLEGEVYGVNMMLLSTIDRNHTAKTAPQWEHHKNQISNLADIDYRDFEDFLMDGKQSEIESVSFPTVESKIKGHITIKTPISFIDHGMGLDLLGKNHTNENSNEEEISYGQLTNKNSSLALNSNTKHRNKFQNVIGNSRHVGKFKTLQKANELSSSSTRNLPTISLYETPPTANSTYSVYEENNLVMDRPPSIESIYEIPEDVTTTRNTISEISRVQLPPTPQTEIKGNGQWTSSEFAGAVLKYLKSMKFHNKEKRVPGTIPLQKASDNFPYASDIKVNVVDPLKIQWKTMDKKNKLPTVTHHPFVRRLTRRQLAKPEINVEVLENDIRGDILKSHAQTKPKYVEVKSRGAVEKYEVDFSLSLEPTTDTNNPKLQFQRYSNKSYGFTMPFLKSIESFTDDAEFDTKKSIDTKNEMYIKTLSKNNIWHNIKSYNTYYTPSKLALEEGVGTNGGSGKPNTRFERHEITLENNIKPLTGIFNHQSDNRVKIFPRHNHKYNELDNSHAAVTEHEYKREVLRKAGNPTQYVQDDNQINEKLKNFNKPVKIGNALSEQHFLGVNGEQKKQSFEGGIEGIPEIQRYRSEWDAESWSRTVPPSLSPRLCASLNGHVLYVQPDESIALTKIPSPSKDINTAMHFIMQNYKECSLKDSVFDANGLLLLQWSTTPVRIIGGGLPETTQDLCF